MNLDPHPDLVVKSGIHRAARCSIQLGSTPIGNRPDSGIVVSDLADGFSIDRSVSQVLLHASKATIEVVGQKPIKPGRQRRCAATTRFSCGGIDFEIVVPPETFARGKRFGLANRTFSFGCGILLAAVTSAVVLSRAAPFPQPATVQAASASAASEEAVRGPSHTRTDSASIEPMLRHRLDSVGLATVATSTQGDGSIEATGEIAPADEVAWHGIGRWFDTVSKGRVVLVDSVRVATIAPPLTVRAVWIGQNPYVVDATGERLFVGSVLPTGWTVQSIDARHVLMKRGLQTIAVKF